jgi:DNA-directed RNA polymerase specialized sigma24 family protein
MAQGKKPMDIQAVIVQAVNTGILAGRRSPGNFYKETEKRLYAYPTLIRKISDDKGKRREIQTHGAPRRDTSVVRFSRTGVRLSPDEIADALVQDMTAMIAVDEHEVSTIAGALQTIEDDPYYAAVAGRFLEKKTDDEIAEAIPCDSSTVRRNRGRLIRQLSVWLYGAQAL